MSEFNNFQEFYKFYMKNHQNGNNRRVHFVGTIIGILIGCYGLIIGKWILLPIALFVAYITAVSGLVLLESVFNNL